MPLTPDEVQRYKRHLVLREIGGQGQQRIKDARVLLVGVGGLGSPLLVYLAAAGVGTIGVIDDDKVSLDNLPRQIAHGTPSVGMTKVASAAQTAAWLNPHVKVEAIEEKLVASNALEVIRRFDIVADGSDNFATRYLVSDACYLARKPLVFGALGPFDGYVSTFKPYEKTASGVPFPTYRCLFPEAPPPGVVANCSEVGVLGPVAGVIGTLMATEVLKEITGAGEGLAGRLIIYDGKDARFETLTVAWDPGNPLSGNAPTIRDLSLHAGPQDADVCREP